MGSKPRKTEPSLDDPHWLPAQEEYKLLYQRRGHSKLASLDMNKALASGRVRCMRRNIESGDPEPLTREFWAHRELVAHATASFTRTRDGPDPVGFVYFLWHPDVEKVWPALRQTDDETAPVRAKPGPKPKDDWHTLIAQWLIAVAVDDPKRLRNVDTLVVEATAFLDDGIEWAPSDRKDLRKKLVELLILVRR
ncbi:hypothetical protein [Bradyrhizobium sp. CCGUVB23]|uniref:hypothetical protein n=1 Tax=Bradyrhizobium sp. CCGUVB23 TaxID=2949630 RepID=UPI0020B3CE95|nr:hypothetical protein [Bradyrhizobium sp. CCGUVB23]MCP3464480.1 hypothetical protein [Bradyrhizobium sp. CCGUVB23]